MIKKRIFFILIFIALSALSFALDAYSLLNYYTESQIGKIVLEADKSINELKKIELYDEQKLIGSYELEPDLSRIIIEFDLALLSFGHNQLEIKIPEIQESLNLEITKLHDNNNSVQINNLTGGLVVDNLPYFPFGFYCYWPVQPTLAEEEVVKGFNMISPYQKILDERFSQRQTYMDRCAELGMKVNYNLCSLAGGGGVGSGKIDLPEKKLNELLEKEVLAFKDHPALLSWYIADEPILNGTKVEYLESKYNLIKKLDPYHPISMVFMKPKNSPKYTKSFDIMMSDPYPIPDLKITTVGIRSRYLKQKFPNHKSTWIVPQAFGGGEWWQREPTKQELRNMTYQAVINGATGIKYFVRNGLNSFPKSTAAWGECGEIALEFAELTPAILSEEIAPSIESADPEIEAKCYLKDNLMTILVVNNYNQPKELNLILEQELSGILNLPFEDRSITIENGEFTDFIDNYGTRCYQYQIMPAESKLASNNITYNGDFEEYFTPGVVAGWYGSVRAERGTTYFMDSKQAYSGSHSMHLINPQPKQGMRLRSFPVTLKADQSYILSIFAKAKKTDYTIVKDLSFWEKIFGSEENKVIPNSLKLSLNGNSQIFELSKEWQEYTIDIPAISKSKRRIISLEYLGKDQIWLDLLQVVPSIQISSKLVDDNIYAIIDCGLDYSDLRYTLDGTNPNSNSLKYSKPIKIDKSCIITAARIINGQPKNITRSKIESHKAIGKKVEYQKQYRKYTAGGQTALVDGKFGSINFKDNRWQGFIYNDLDVTIDLERCQKIDQISINFLENLGSWIFLPTDISFMISIDGINFNEIDRSKYKLPHNYRKTAIHTVSSDKQTNARYIRIKAKNPGYCPDWHSGSGKPAWIFADEIIVR